MKMEKAIDPVVPYFYKAIDVFAEFVSPYVNEHQLNETCKWLKENDKAIILSTVGAITFASIYLLISGKDTRKSKKNKKKNNSKGEKKSYQVKVKKEKVIPVDPVKLAYDTIKNVKEELENQYISQVDKLEKDIELEQEAKKAAELASKAKSKSNLKSKSKKSKKSKSNNSITKKIEEEEEEQQPIVEDTPRTIPYKETTKYRYLYLNECLLKLLMSLDGVEPNGIEDIRAQRKAAIKEVQVQCKRLDAIKAFT